MFEKAAACMGLTDSKGQIDPNSKRFSSDVLKIELVGPSQPFLTVVDVPGKIILSCRVSSQLKSSARVRALP